jgi:filamentous hemagglutinin family protein
MADRQGQAATGRIARALLLRSASAAALVAILATATPAYAQLAARRGPTLTAPVIAPRAVPGQIRRPAQVDALDRQVQARSRAEQIRAYATQARAAVQRSVPDGTQGLVVARGVTAEALAAGALQAARDSTGRTTWQGAGLPVTTSGDGDKLTVTVTQTDSRAILSWDRFDVGAKTTLVFDQKLNGVGQKDWVAVNRVVDPGAAPSQILGQIKADGTVVVINRNGVIFGKGAHVSANSLLASSLDIGNAFKAALRTKPGTSQIENGLLATTLQDRNIAFLQNGLLQGGTSQQGIVLAGTLTSSLVDGFYTPSLEAIESAYATSAEGDIVVERGASIAAGKGGFVILTGPKVANDGALSAEEGQVSLQAGRAITVTPSTGGASSVDANIRGLILRTSFGGAGSEAANSGLIETKRGYASLGAGLSGSVLNAGLVSATTSVSRNGSIDLMAGTVTLAGASDPAQASGLVITPDSNGETIPQGTPADPANFKTSQIRIGGVYLDPTDGSANPLGEFGPGAITIGENALIHAPAANVQIGGKTGEVFSPNRFVSSTIPDALTALAASHVDIAAGALIDVSGVKDVQLEASRNSLLIDPVKRNELRDTPNYRETNTNGEFTLNGSTVYVDPRVTGMRDDGVNYVGSPLIESGSAASQIGVTAAELMTRGGTINLNTGILEGSADLATAPRINIARGATLDISGGWVSYLPGVVRTSRLLTVDGRVVDIGKADPNDRFVAVGDGFTEVQAKFGISRNYANSILQGAHFESGYDEGRDAGALILSASSAALDGTLHGDAFAGLHQLSDARRPTGTSTVAGDPRKRQARAVELPSGGYLRIGAFDRASVIEQTADIVVGRGDTEAPAGAIVLDDRALSSAGLSAIALRTTGGVNFEQGTDLHLAEGGSLSVVAGRAVRIDGNITSPSGSISVGTIDFGKDIFGASLGSIGSPFRSDDDLLGNYAQDPGLHPFDISVTGKLSTAGLWVNDFGGTDVFRGNAWKNGGSISLNVAPRVLVGIGGTTASPDSASDFSGSIRIASSALLDVSSGGYVGTDGALDLTGTGGNVSLINETRYASATLTDVNTDSNSRAVFALGGTNQSVQFTPYRVGEATVVPSLMPDNPVAEVAFDVSSIKGFGFAGGGTFTLVAPDIAMGSQPGVKGPRVGLDFLQKTGFGTLSLTANKSRFVANLFDNGRTGLSAFLDTERFVVASGETLDLTQTVLPSLLDNPTQTLLTQLATGADITSVLVPGVPDSAWDRKAAHLRLGGVSELDVAEGATISGAAGASITAPRIYSAGTIRIAGGQINQVDTLENLLTQRRVIGVRDAAFGGGGLADVFGGSTPGQTSGFDEAATAAVEVYRNTAQTQRLTNGQLFSLVDRSAGGDSLDVNLVFTGRVALNEGVRFTATSVTDLSGTALYDPRAPFLANGQQQRSGTMIGGGSIATSRFGAPLETTGYSSPIDPSNKLVAEAGATINLNGASGSFDQRISRTAIGAVAQWSDGGRLTIGNGAQLKGAHISAFGGDDGDGDLAVTRAVGGVLDWVAPVIRQDDDGSDPSGSTLSATQVMDSGFATLVARNGFSTAGDVTLQLGKSFIATTNSIDGDRTLENLVISALPDSNARILAPYVALASSNKDIGGQGVSSGAGHLTISARAIDLIGAVEFNVSSRTDGVTRGSVTLEATGDIRLTGTAGLRDSATGLFEPGLSGQLVSNGDLLLKSAQVYATTGTGNLQQLLEDRRAGRQGTPDPFVIASSNVDGLVKFEGLGGELPPTPYSAGSYLAVRGAHIEQDGVLRAPLGMLDIGSNEATALNLSINAPATQSLYFGPDSLTSVSARTSLAGTDALNIPYGTTTDLIEYFFTPGTNSILTAPPVGELRFAGKDITVDSTQAGIVRVDGRGGGDVFAYEFIPGTGGSRDVLDRLNPDGFSGNNGLQFPDGRQVYAIVPKNSATVALFDPVYSADYAGGGGVDLYGLNAGMTVRLDAAPGIEAGEYLLLPAHYALLPGAMRIVENAGAAAPYTGGASTLLDGSLLVGGVYGTAGTGFAQSKRRSFTVQSQAVFKKYSRIETTSGTGSAEQQAEHKGLSAPLLPRDAARVVLAPLTSLKVAGAFATDAAKDGLGAQVDAGGSKIRIAAPGAVAEDATADYVLLTTDTLSNFHANSLSIGALRSNNVDGTTGLDVVARTIQVDNDVEFTAPELLLSVGGSGSLLSIEGAADGAPGARLTATGTLNDSRTGDYIINARAARNDTANGVDQTGAGALIRLATGAERLVSREGDFLSRTTILPAKLEIGAGARLGAGSITLDSSRDFAIDSTALIGGAEAGQAFDLAISGDALRIGGLTFSTDIEAQFGLARSLTYRTPDILNFAAGTYNYRNLKIDAAGIGLAQAESVDAAPRDVTLNADHVELRNSSVDLGACKTSAALACAAQSALTIDAADITFGGGIFRTYGFDAGDSGSGITLRAREGMFLTGHGEFNTVNFTQDQQTPLNLVTPFIVDRTAQDLLNPRYVRPDFAFTTIGAIAISGASSPLAPTSGKEAPGARIAFASGNAAQGINSDITITDTLVRATAGTIDIRSTGSILLQGSASLQTPGYTKSFSDGIEQTTVSAGGGVINLVTTGTGTRIATDASTSLVVDSGIGEAGSLNIAASRGDVDLRSTLNAGVAADKARAASLALDAGNSAFDLSGFVAANGLHFQGKLAIRTGSGDLALQAGQELKADAVSLTADGGSITIGGRIDTSGDDVRLLSPTDPRYKKARIDGGAIALYGQDGVTVQSSASLLSRTSGYAADDGRQASGGDIAIGIGMGGSAAITIDSGAQIDVSALRPGNRLIEEVATDPLTLLESKVFRLAPGDRGGTVSYRAPVLADNSVAITADGTVTGAREQVIEGYRRFDLDTIASSGQFSGVALLSGPSGTTVTLDAGAVSAGKANFLGDLGLGTIPEFIRNFSITDSSGNPFSRYRLRPGVELNSANGIRLVSNWNLGAGRIVNADGTAGYDDAVAAGLLVESALGPHVTGPLAGQKRYEVVAGKEGDLFDRFTDMTYRVGGNARGEAPVLALRAVGNLEIQNSISDGFFAFRDFTGADYINYQLGGGNRTFNPALKITCGATCSDSILYSDVPPGTIPGTAASRVTIDIAAGAQQGTQSSPLFVNAAYNPLANSAAATGTGNAIGTAELFPLLSDGSAASSSNLKLVGGALQGSANPLQIDVTGAGSVQVSGEKSYQITATGSTGRLKGLLQLVLNAPDSGTFTYGLNDLLGVIDGGEQAEFGADYFTVLNWGDGSTGAAGAARTAALAYAGFQGNAQFVGAEGHPSGVAARLRDIVAFLRDSGFAETYASGVEQKLPGYTAVSNISSPTVRLQSNTAYVGTLVRTGDGSIDIAAAGDIDLRRTADVVTRNDPGADLGVRTLAQVGGTAVYTAGVRASAADLAGGQLPAFDGYAARSVPGPTGGVALAPVVSKDGGSVTLKAGRDIVGRRDLWNELFGQNGSQIAGLSLSPIMLARDYAQSTALMTPSFAEFGRNSSDQRWRYGSTSLNDTQASVAANLFTSGIGALAGGDVSVHAGRDLTDLTIALDNSLATTVSSGANTLVPLGAGDLDLSAGRHLLGGQFDIALGSGSANVGGNVDAAGLNGSVGSYVVDNRNLLRVRVADATFHLSAKGDVTIGGLGALGLGRTGNSGLETAGFFSALAGVSAQGTGDVRIIGNRPDLYVVQGVGTRLGTVLPPSLELTAFHGDIAFGTTGELNLPKLLYASRYGQLSLLAGGDIGHFGLAMSDAAPVNFFGTESLLKTAFPTITSSTRDSDLRLLHNRRITHADDSLPVRIVAGGSIEDVVLSLPKQARIRADGDILDLYFTGQNIRPTDITRISAGGDITGTTGVSSSGITQGRSAVLGNNITLGGPGSLFIEAGRDLGPFITSATGAVRSEAGGIRTIGNEANPWLASQGANIYVLFGVGKGANYTALQSTYLDPANLVNLDGDLFEQNRDALGNAAPDRTRFGYAPVLAEWLRDNQPALFAAVFGQNPPAGDALRTQAYARYADVYAAFAGMDQLTRNRFLIDKVYFGELAAPADPKSPSFNQFVRGYRAAQTLFPASLGYTDNLATYQTDPSTINADHPLGVPVKKLVNGQPAIAERVETGNVDLRLSTVQTSRGGDVTILGPGGSFVAGSVVRTESQINRRITAYNVATEIDMSDLVSGNYLAVLGSRGQIRSIPAGFEGILTLRGGQIRSFTDGNFALNQSRLFAQRGGDITLWSSNGDLNAGQGPKNASSFPPIVLRFDPNAYSEVDSAGSVAGAGIGAFKATPDDPSSAVRLIAPVGTVDAGDAGVRASGDVFVAAARVANADSFAAGGAVSGVPSVAVAAAPPAPASAASALAASVMRSDDAMRENAQRMARIFVDVLGYVGGSSCPDGEEEDEEDGRCKAE